LGIITDETSALAARAAISLSFCTKIFFAWRSAQR